MNAVIHTAINELEYGMIKIPVCSDDEIKVRIKKAAICNGSDPNLLLINKEKFPYVFGHEPYGTVVELGKNIRDIHIGDRVTWWFSLGAFAKYATVNPNRVVLLKVPDYISDDEAPVMELVIACCRAVNKDSIRQTKKLLIIGLGPSGLIMIQMAKALGVEKIAGWDLCEARRKKALSLGCDAAYDPNGLINNTIMDIEKYDTAIDAMGNDLILGQPTFNLAMDYLNNNSSITVYGHPTDKRIVDTMKMQKKNISIVSPTNDFNKIKEYLSDVIKMISDSQLSINEIISKKIMLYEVPDVLNEVINKNWDELKIIVDIEGEKVEV
jgi:threonine dehydrogenase-like Zn-dependent dehydrogenase